MLLLDSGTNESFQHVHPSDRSYEIVVFFQIQDHLRRAYHLRRVVVSTTRRLVEDRFSQKKLVRASDDPP